MAERFRIDLGFPALYASLSMDTTGITDGVVVYDKERQQLFYTGSYGAGGGGGGGGVTSLDGLTGAIDLIAGPNITITTGSGTITISGSGGGGGGGGYWELVNNKIVNSGSLNVIVTSSLTIDQFTANDDIFIIKRSGVSKVKVNNQGVLTLMPTGSFPTAVTGGIIYKDNEFYFGFQ
jgi:hypothetical protein